MQKERVLLPRNKQNKLARFMLFTHFTFRTKDTNTHIQSSINFDDSIYCQQQEQSGGLSCIRWLLKRANSGSSLQPQPATEEGNLYNFALIVVLTIFHPSLLFFSFSSRSSRDKGTAAGT